ncbi:hypothetical protein AAY473_031599 [Plecturocebus cupreus]
MQNIHPIPKSPKQHPTTEHQLESKWTLTLVDFSATASVSPPGQGLEAHQLIQVTGNRAWSGPQQSYSREARLLEGKLRNRNNFIINKLDVHSEAQSESQQLQRRQEDKYTKMGRNQRKKDENA